MQYVWHGRGQIDQPAVNMDGDERKTDFGWPAVSPSAGAGVRPTTAMSDDGGRSRQFGGQIDLGFPVCPYFQKKTVTAATPSCGTKWRRGGRGGLAGQGRGEGEQAQQQSTNGS